MILNDSFGQRTDFDSGRNINVCPNCIKKIQRLENFQRDASFKETLETNYNCNFRIKYTFETLIHSHARIIKFQASLKLIVK